MASLQLHNVGKRFNSNWLFRNINIEIKQGEKIAVTGNNGSGKSTLLQLISGFARPSEGKIDFSVRSQSLEIEKWYTQFSWCAPYIDIPGDFTPVEMISFYREHKSLQKNISTTDLIALCQLSDSSSKAIKLFSSGMQQRLKLGMAVLTDAPLLLLDEPLNNLDENGVHFYQQLLKEYTAEKTVIICSNNNQQELFYCERKINIHDYKLK